MAKKRKSNRTLLSEWSKAVRARDGQVCGVCGSEKYLNAHHILPKERYADKKLDIINGVSLCPTCHKFGKYSAHRNAIWFSEWLKKNKPQQWEWANANL